MRNSANCVHMVGDADLKTKIIENTDPVQLTELEKDVLILLVEGRCIDEISQKIGLSEMTVMMIKNSLYSKAFNVAFRNGVHSGKIKKE